MGTMTIDARLNVLAEVEALEAEVYKAAVVWAPAGRTAKARKDELASAERAVVAAKMDFDASIGAVAERDSALADELYRLAAGGQLTKEVIGPNATPLIIAVVTAQAAVKASVEGVVTVRQLCSDAHAASAHAWRDVLLALDALRAQSAEVLVQDVSRTIIGSSGGLGAAPPNGDSDGVAVRCRARLEVLGG